MSLRKQATSGLVWTFAQQFGNQIVGFAVSMILARVLMPEEFGLIGMIAIFISVGKALVDSGLTQSLIRSQELNQEDFSTVFFFNLAASIFVYTLIFFLSPLISDFYDRDILTPLVRLFCITFIIDAFSSVQRARLTKIMNFKTQTMIAIPSTIFGGVVGITMAYMGYGVWSLVWSTIASSTLGSMQFWMYSKWAPSFVFNFTKFKDHFKFGYKLTLSSLLSKIFDNIYLIVIGKYFSASQVGFYTRAETMKQLPVTNISAALGKVTYPLFASIQDDDIRLKRVYKQLMQMVVFIIAPTLIIMAVLAEPTFRFLFTEKWLPAVPYFQILCVTGILYPIHAYNLNVLKVKGRSDLFLRLEIIKKVVIVVAILISINYGIIALLYGQVVTSILAFIINTHYTGKFINYSAWEQTKDIIPIILLAVLAAGCVFIFDYYLQLLNQLDIIRILGGSFLALLVYLPLAKLFRFNSLNDIIKLIIKR